MKIGILGTGVVGSTIGTRLVQLGHEVMMGSRTPQNEKASAWAATAGERASIGTFADAASFGEMILNCTSGVASLAALEQAGASNLSGKILVDIANPLDFSQGFPPSLSVCNTDSLGEQIQSAYPDLRVVKTLNTMTSSVMVDPTRVPGDHSVFLSGNDADAKEQVAALLESFGWKRQNIIALGDITTSRGTEMLLPVWVRLWGALGDANFNFAVVRASPAAN